MTSAIVARIAGLFMLLTVYAVSASATPVYSFQTINIPGAAVLYSGGINNAGQIVGSFATNLNFDYTAFVYDLATGAITTFQAPNVSAGSEATGINDLGQVTVIDQLSYASYERDPVTGNLTSLGTRDALGINNSGQILAQSNRSSSTPFSEVGVVFDPNTGRTTTLSALPTSNATFPSAIDNLGPDHWALHVIE